MRLTPKQRQSHETPAARVAAHELEVRAIAALSQGMPAQAWADADAVMAAHADAGPAGEPHLTARQFRALAMGQLGQHAAAAGEYARLIDDAIPFLGDKDARVVTWQVHRAGQLAYLGRYDEAEAEFRTAIKQSGKIWPQRARDTFRLVAAAFLVTVLNERGLHTQAESTARTAIRDAKGSPTAHSGSLVLLGTGLAASLNGQHRYQEAERTVQDLQPRQAADRVRIQSELGAARLGLGMPAEAEAAAREAVTEAERALGPAHYLTLAAGTLLGSAIARQGRHDEARHQLQANAEAWLERFGENHPRTIDAQEELAKVSPDRENQ
jgi:tetratricopeptide (TPR) repeat protein